MGETQRMRWFALLVVLALAAASCASATEFGGPPEATSTSTTTPLAISTTVPPVAEEETTTTAIEVAPAPAGTLVWVHDLEPLGLHADDPENISDVAAWVQQGLLEGLFGIDREMSYYPELLASEPVLGQLNSGTVVIDFTLRPGLTWSDGTALTAEDVAYTHKVIVEGCEVESDRSIVDSTNEGCEYALSSRIGYELITDFDVVSPTEFKVTMAAFFPGWRNLYSTVFAAHAFGDDARSVNQSLEDWRNGAELLPSSGPLVFTQWEAGQHIDLGRNDSYHGSVAPDSISTGPISIEGVRLMFITDLTSRMTLLADGDVHLMMTPMEPALARLTEDESVVVSSIGGAVFEHLGINLLNPHLAKPQVREAIAYAIDKSQIVSEIYQPLIGPVLDTNGQGNVYWMASQAAYEDHQSGYRGAKLDAAASSLRDAGYVQANGGWEHPDDGRLVLRAGTTAGDRLREQQLELIQAQLGEAGIEIAIENAPGGLFFTDGPFSPDALAASASSGRSGDSDVWDIAQFAWASGPWPGLVSGIYRSGSSSNPYGFNNPAFDVAASECDALIDDAERAICYNDVDTYVTTLDKGDDGLFVIPLTQKPTYVAYSATALSAIGVTTDLRAGGPLINLADYQLTG